MHCYLYLVYVVKFIVLQLFTVSRDSPSWCARYDRLNCFTCTLRACVWNMLPIYKSIYRHCHMGYLFVVVVTFCLLSHDDCQCVCCTQWHLPLFRLGAACVHWNTGGSNGVLFLQCFDTVGLVIWPVKVVPEMTYNVSSGTLSLYTTTTTVYFSRNYFCVVFIHSLTSLIWDTFAYSVFSLNVCMSCIHTEWPEKARTSYNSRLSGLALYLFILLMTPVDVTCDRVCWV